MSPHFSSLYYLIDNDWSDLFYSVFPFRRVNGNDIVLVDKEGEPYTIKLEVLRQEFLNKRETLHYLAFRNQFFLRSVRFCKSFCIEEYFTDSLTESNEACVMEQIVHRFTRFDCSYAIVIDVKGYSLDEIDWDSVVINQQGISFFPDMVGLKQTKLNSMVISVPEGVEYLGNGKFGYYFNSKYSGLNIKRIFDG